MNGFLHGFLPLFARLLLSAIFVASGIHKLTDWSGTADRMTAEGMVAVQFLLAGAVVFELGGGLMLLFGFKGRFGALLLMIFLVPTTVIFHDFWAYTGQEQQMQMINFMKNLAIFGGLTMVLAYGPGTVSVDAMSRRSSRRTHEAPSGAHAHPAR